MSRDSKKKIDVKRGKASVIDWDFQIGVYRFVYRCRRGAFHMRPQTSKIHVCLGLWQLRADMESAPTTVSDRTDKPKFAKPPAERRAVPGSQRPLIANTP